MEKQLPGVAHQGWIAIPSNCMLFNVHAITSLTQGRPLTVAKDKYLFV